MTDAIPCQLDRSKFFSISRPCQPQHHRPAMRTDRGIGGGPQLVENVHHFLVGHGSFAFTAA